MKLDHINISAPSDLLVEVKEFYCNILALVVGARPAFNRAGFWLYSQDQAVLHLIESDSHHAYDRPGYLDHVAFSHMGLDKFVNTLESSGVHYQTAYIPDLDLTQIFLHDPAGIKLEINFYGEQLV